MTKEKYDVEWQALVEDFLARLVTDDPKVPGAVVKAAGETLRRMMILRQRSAEDAE